MDERVYDILEFAIEGKEAVKTVFYSTDSTSGSVWCVKPGQEVACHTHNNSDDIWIYTRLAAPGKAPGRAPR